MSSFSLTPGGAMRGQLFGSMMEVDRPTGELRSGTIIGRFRVQRLVGSGGAASVYRGQRCDGAFDQTVAIKVAHKPAQSAESFATEQSMLGRLRHPVFSTILDSGVLADGRAWIAMELVEGVPIDEWCIRSKPSWRKRVRLVAKLADGLQHAHEVQVAHRDVKPGNVLVTAAGDPKLIDLGIAAKEGTYGARAFTPGYASPEQLSGNVATLATDVYQLGCLLDVILWPSDHAIPDLARDRPMQAVLKRIVGHATQEDPAHRYPSAADLRRDLLLAMAERPIEAGFGKRVYWFSRRHRRLVVAGALAVLSITFATSYYSDEISSSHQQQRRLSETTSGTVGILPQVFSMAVGGDRDAAVALIGRTAAGAHPAASSNPVQYTATITSLAEAYLALNQPSLAADLLRTALSTLPAESHFARSDLLLLLARVQVALGDVQEASTALDGSVALQNRLGLSSSLETARRELVRAEILHAQGAPVEALRHARSAMATARRFGSEDQGVVGQAQLLEARIQFRLNHSESARRAFESALENIREFRGADAAIALDVEREVLFNKIADGDNRGARETLERQKAMVVRLYGEHTVEYADLLDSYGTLEWSLERYGEAETFFRQEIALLERLRPAKPSLIPTAIQNLADVQFDAGRFEDAYETYGIANAMRAESGLGETSVAAFGFMKQQAAKCQIDRVEALRHFPAARVAMAKFYPPKHRNMAAVDIYQASCLIKLGRKDEARELFVPANRIFSQRKLPAPWMRRLQAMEADLAS